MVAVLRFLSERLLALLTTIAGTAFWAQGLAFGLLAFGVLPRMVDGGAVRWVEVGMRSSLILGGIFATGGVLMLVVRFASAVSRPVPAATGRDGVAILSLLAFSVAAFLISSPLRGLWEEILVLLGRAGGWGELVRNSAGAGSGLVLAPLFGLLYTPLLAALAALALITLPALLALARAARSPRFGTLLASAVICSSVLVVAAWFAAEAFQRLVTMAEPMLRQDPDPTGTQVANLLTRGAAVLVRSVRAQGLILGCLWVLWPFLRQRPSTNDELELAERDSMASEAATAVSRAANRWATDQPSESQAPSDPQTGDDGSTTVGGGRVSTRGSGWVSSGRGFAATAALVLGCFMLTQGIVDRIRPRASATSSDPFPGARLESAPAEVLVTFDRPLAAGSWMTVSQTGALDPETGQLAGGAGEIARPGRIDPENRRLLRTEISPPAGAGLYWVEWRAVSTGFGVPRRGSFPFVVGPVASDLIGGPSQPSPGRDENQRRRRSVFLGGIVFLLLGAMHHALRTSRPG